MKSEFAWSDFAIALTGGLAIGILVPLTAHYFGMSAKLVGPITGVLAVSLIPLIYRMRRHKRGNAGKNG